MKINYIFYFKQTITNVFQFMKESLTLNTFEMWSRKQITIYQICPNDVEMVVLF